MNDPAYQVGSFVGGFIVFPLVIFGIGYGFIRLVKKRKPTKKEITIIAIIAFVLTVLGQLGRVARTAQIGA